MEQRGRSVNLALSVRGIESLRAVGAEGPVNITTTLNDNHIKTSSVDVKIYDIPLIHAMCNCVLK